MLLGHPRNVVGVAFSPDGSVLASSGIGEEIVIWSAGGNELHRIQTDQRAVGAVAFTRDGKHLIRYGSEGRLALWSTRDWTETRSWESEAGGGSGLGLDLDPTDPVFAVTAANNFCLWSLDTGELLDSHSLGGWHGADLGTVARFQHVEGLSCLN